MTDCCGERILNPDTGSYTSLPTSYPDLGCSSRAGPWSPDAARLACEGFGDQTASTASTRSTPWTAATSNASPRAATTIAPATTRRTASASSSCVVLRLGVQLFVVKTDGTGLRQLTPAGMDSLNFNCGSWSPQGNEILFSAHAPSDEAPSSVHADGSGLRQIPIAGCGGLISDPTTIGCFGPSWSPDGSKIVFVRRSAAQNDIYTVSANGTNSSVVSGTPLDEGGPPDWGTHSLISAR